MFDLSVVWLGKVSVCVCVFCISGSAFLLGVPSLFLFMFDAVEIHRCSREIQEVSTHGYVGIRCIYILLLGIWCIYIIIIIIIVYLTIRVY